MYLVVAFDRLGQRLMDDKADVRFVDAHPKGYRGADHPHTVL